MKTTRCSFDFVCDQKWEDLERTESDSVRNCNQCSKSVTKCRSLEEILDCARNGKCIVYDAGYMLKHMEPDERELFLNEQKTRDEYLSGITVGRIVQRPSNLPETEFSIEIPEFSRKPKHQSLLSKALVFLRIKKG